MSLSGSKPMQRGSSHLVPEIHHAHFGDIERSDSYFAPCVRLKLAAIFVEPSREGDTSCPHQNSFGLQPLR